MVILPMVSVYSLLKQIPGQLFRSDEVPLFGAPPPFPWSAVASQLASTFEMQNLSLTPSPPEWKQTEEILTGLGDKVEILSLNASFLEGYLCCIIPKNELKALMSFLFKSDESTMDVAKEEFERAFLNFLAAQTLQAIESSEFDKKLTFTILEEPQLPEENCLTYDINISCQDFTTNIRLALPAQFLSSLRKRYAQTTQDILLNSPLADSISLDIHLEAGKTSLKFSEWKTIKVDDWVLLESCSMDVDEDKGRVLLTVDGIPLFRGKIKQGSLKILEFPLYQEASNMDSDDTQNTNENSELNDSTFDFEDSDFADSDFADSTFEESKTDNTEESQTQDESHAGEESGFDVSEIEQESQPEESDLIDSEIDQTLDKESEIESSEIENSLLEESVTDANASEKLKVPQKAKSSKEEDPSPTNEKMKSAAIEDILMPIVVEVGRIQMSIKKILELHPGNVIELDAHTESPVTLTVNGKKIGKGELLRIGDLLGVRILEIL